MVDPSSEALQPSSGEAGLRELIKDILDRFDVELTQTNPSDPEYLKIRNRYTSQVEDLFHQREKEVRKEVKEEVLDTVMGIDARFNPSPSDVRNKIIKAIESLEEE